MITENISEGLTFDDVLLVPARSDVLPTETDTSTQFTRGIRLQIPLCSAAMDTVTEASLAIAIAQQGGISGVPVVDEDGHLVGIITNRDLRFEERFDLPVSEVMTKQPLVTVSVGTTLDQAKQVLQKHRIEKLLVIDEDKHLKGLITVKDIQKAIKYPTAAKDNLGRLRVA